MKIYPDFPAVIQATSDKIRTQAYDVHTDKWQGFDIADRPEAAMKEIMNWNFQVPLGHESLMLYAEQIHPNMPWANDHFHERVAGEPVNPGETWLTWPWANKADESRCFPGGKFSHTYMERYWPKNKPEDSASPMWGHRFKYGDLMDVVNLLEDQPETRQAYLPIFFPEDTGALHGNRVPCTLGYFFMMRHGYLHIHYPIRSCDFYRHFRDDLYLTTRLLLWVLDELRQRDDGWHAVKPGFFSMWIGSLHLFINDYNRLYGNE